MNISQLWCNFIVRFSYSITFLIVLISLLSFFYSYFYIKTPDFSDPQLGFETRGTDISNRIITWKILHQVIEPSGSLSSFPIKNVSHPINLITKREVNKKPRKKWKSKHKKEPFFCGIPGPQYSQIILKSDDTSDIFTLSKIQLICKMGEFLMGMDEVQNICEMESRNKKCCRIWNLANYLAFQNNKTSCKELTIEDLEYSKEVLQKCVKFYAQLSRFCFDDDQKCNLPQECVENNIVFYLLNFIIDVGFVNNHNISVNRISETAMYFPIARSSSTLEFYQRLEEFLIRDTTGLKIVAADFGLKDTLFHKYLIDDAIFLTGGVIFLAICIWFYTESVFITLVTFYSILSSVVFSYYVYFEIFNLTFFPFMNMLAIVVSLGIGTDDAFIFCTFWKNETRIRSDNFQQRLKLTWSHAIPSIFLTTLTTAISFYSSAFNSITAIRCFSIFSGTIVIVNFLMILTLFPACLILEERWNLRTCNKFKTVVQTQFGRLENWVVELVVNYRMVWLVLLTLASIVSGYIVWYDPQLKLPSNKEFQLFKISHVFEQFDFEYKNKFFANQQDPSSEFSMLPIYMVWGLQRIDNGDYMNPYSYGSLTFDPNFNITTKAAQKWLFQFCSKIKSQPFYRFTVGPQLLNCFIESFVRWMQRRRCIDPVNKEILLPCCQNSTFPYEEPIFNQCVLVYMNELAATPQQYLSSYIAGPKFGKRGNDLNRIKVLVLEFPSNYSFTYNFYEMHDFYKSVETWVQEQLETAPLELQSGFFCSYLEYYDLQFSLASDTLNSVVFSTVLASVILLLVTGNIVVNILATVTIIATIQTVIAMLVLLDWRLNILESIALSSSVGLTVDFSLHYSISYILTKHPIRDRFLAGRNSLLEMIAPTTMACITTAAPGFFMMFSKVQPYIQIGTFLIITMTLSWVYSTFLFGSSLVLFGPEKSFGQINYLKMCRFKRDKESPERNEEAQMKLMEATILRSKSLPDCAAKNILNGSRPKSSYF